ncbi:MAG: hypothetical protein ACI9G1_002882 [Pirellulaceae bacterium]|jgi:hypothetical protein
MLFRHSCLLVAVLVFAGCRGPWREHSNGDVVEWDRPTEEMHGEPMAGGTLAESETCGRCGTRLRGRNCRKCQVAGGNYNDTGIEPPWPRFHPLPTRPVFEPELPQYPNIIPRAVEKDEPPVAPVGLYRLSNTERE